MYVCVRDYAALSISTQHPLTPPPTMDDCPDCQIEGLNVSVIAPPDLVLNFSI